MSVSQAILKKGRGTCWRIEIADEAIEHVADGDIYQQEGLGLETYIVHSCPNLGEPFDSARHRAALAVYTAAEKMPRKPFDAAARRDAIAALRIIWDATK